MKGTMKEKRVSWASDSDLRQVMLFHSKDCPSQVRQPKTSHAVASDFLPGVDVPPGFGGIHPVKQIMKKTLRIPCISWTCPPKFCVSSEWQVAAGEESQEAGVQKHRESTILEAVYPSTYSIPASPSVTSDVQGEQYDDNLTPSIPIIPIEEMESAQNTIVHEVAVNCLDQPMQSKGLSTSKCTIESKPKSPAFAPSECKTSASSSTGLDADIAGAASVALAILLKSSEMGSSIDTDLLIKMFSDPKMVKQLIDRKALSLTPDDGTPIVQNSGHPAVMNSCPNSSVGPSVLESNPSVASSYGQEKSCAPNISASPAILESKTSVASSYGQLSCCAPNGSGSPSILESKPSVASSHGQLNCCAPNGSVSPAILESKTSVASSYGQLNCCAPNGSVSPSILESKPSVASSYGQGIMHPSTRPPSQPGISLPNSSSPINLPPMSSLSANRIGNLCRVPNQPIISTATQPYVSTSIKAQIPVKDVNYYKDLIRQHGGEMEKNTDNIFKKTGFNEVDYKNMVVHQKLKAEELTIKSQKRCVFFNTPKGCRKGSSCPFLHVVPPSNNWRAPSLVEGQSSKRMRLGGEIMGR